MRRHATLVLLLAGGLSLLLALGGCDSLSSYNENPNQASSANPNNLLSNAQRYISEEVFGGTRTMRRANVWAQYTTQNFYPSESRYSPVDYAWGGIYNRLNDLRAAKKIARERPNTVRNQDNFQAVATIMQVWAFQILTDAYGDIPFFGQALQGRENRSPSYTSQSEIYPVLVDSLNTALSRISVDGEGPSGDLVNGGDMRMWKRFANGLKMRIGLRAYDAAGSGSWAEQAVTSANGKALQSNDDNVYFQFGTSSDHRNSYYVNREVDFRDDFDGSERFIEFLKSGYGSADPRLDAYFEQTSNSNRPCEDGSGEYKGFPFAQEQGSAQSLYGANPTCVFSRPEAWFPNGPSGNGDAFAPMMYYDEVLLTKAWAAEKGLISGNPQQLIAQAIRASVGFYASQTDADISASGSATQGYISAVQSEFSSAPMQVIGEQRYISFYMHNIQGWSTWRRFDFEGVLGSPVGGVAGGFDAYAPLRVDYPDSEYNLNERNVRSAAENMCGGVEQEDEACQMWWDMEGPPSDAHAN
ncbi:hypothetical protein BSZ35_02360 [Salinibacter sp. 10B]|uniref:SusD/RagB family nutrient-binding outer membrane lipoprotein n=1 Tax=Salinibacter sp. 10B TaxID=1923971 RepID=UPI000CF52CE4|nr:SusD/RagB family nutrient-binding outer membrane lipoprotein [Salinibacter sp. 10B]PQJ33595.1 hypothetical protein BSZ35_02360 [Salinibacter sp. 10B]